MTGSICRGGGCSAWILAYGQSHGLELAPNQLHHHALLQGSRATAKDRPALLSKEEEFVLQVSLEGIGQTSPIDHKAGAGARDGGCRGRAEGGEAHAHAASGLLGGTVGAPGLHIV